MINNIKVVVIGGGTGLSILLQGLKQKFHNLTAIVTVADDGGGSGVLREDLGMLPPGDIRSCIIALANTEPTMEKLLNHRFSDGRLKGQSFGNLFIAAMNEISGSFEDAIKKASEILAVTGRVLPVSNEDVHLVAHLENGKIIKGESNIPKQVLKEGSRIDKITYDKENVKPILEVKEAILSADIIIVGPGSLYTSIMPSLIIEDVQIALKKSNAQKIFVSNVMTQPGETDNYSIREHYQAAIKHLGNDIFDYIIANEGSLKDEIREKYSKEHSEILFMEEEDTKFFKEKNVEVLKDNFIEVKKGYVRHDALKIAEKLVEIVKIKIYNCKEE